MPGLGSVLKSLRVSFYESQPGPFVGQKMKMRAFAVAALFLISSISAFARDIAMVVNKSSANKTVAAADINKMLKGTKKWPDGKDLVIVMKDPTAAEMKVVIQKLFGQTPAEFKATVESANKTKKVFVFQASDDAIIKTVDGTPNAVGLVDVYSITGAVSVVKLDGKLPLEPGYTLHGQ